jgi:hypothetical protein
MAKYKDKDGSVYDESAPVTSTVKKEVTKANGYRFGGGGDAKQFHPETERFMRGLHGTSWDKLTPEEKYDRKLEFERSVSSASGEKPSGGGGGGGQTRHTTR